MEKFLFNAKKTMSEKSAMELSDKIFNMEKFSVRELISCMSGS
jgi:hypothetical protein